MPGFVRYYCVMCVLGMLNIRRVYMYSMPWLSLVCRLIVCMINNKVSRGKWNRCF
jgi:hypothetical protein